MKHILIFSEDGKSNLKDLIKVEGYEVLAQTTEEIKDCAQFHPSLIVIDAPVETVKNIAATTKFIAPLLVVADNIIDELTVRGESYDYILQPINEKELSIRVANLLKIKYLKEKMGFICTTDELTGLHNRKYVYERLEAEISRSKRYGFKLSCLLLDIDYFKVVNDIYGYDWGDVLLKQIADTLRKHVRKEDILTRYGDEEFLIILPNTDESNAFIFSERVRQDIEKLVFQPDGEEEPHPITISGGISCYPFLANVDESANTLIRYSEHALYNAKKRGKNKIVQFSQINIEF
ncbi:MAG: GGDEF domain-containing protein [Candidatus Gastranaerophilales bacterium]|nr:GGDEF domain-containing protein [Candidatus Gastranaerophilales bacterium]